MNNIELVKALRDSAEFMASGGYYDEADLMKNAADAITNALRCPFDQTAIGSFSGPREGCDHFPPVKFDGWQCSRCGITAEELASTPGGLK